MAFAESYYKFKYNYAKRQYQTSFSDEFLCLIWLYSELMENISLQRYGKGGGNRNSTKINKDIEKKESNEENNE